jgi:hypothetical protein
MPDLERLPVKSIKQGGIYLATFRYPELEIGELTTGGIEKNQGLDMPDC